MKKTSIFVLSFIIILFLIWHGCQNHVPNEDEKSKTADQKITLPTIVSDSTIWVDLYTMAGTDHMPDEITVDIEYDPFFKAPKSYRGYSLNSLLAPYLEKLQIQGKRDSNAVITFICADGYKPTIQVNELFTAEGYIVFCDESLSEDDQCWPDSVKSKFLPYYLVWKDVHSENQIFPWPYGLEKIKIDKSNTIYDAIYPFNNEEAVPGFNLFRMHCIKCHSINKIGGNVGPDFNYPKNITDYWKIEDMWEYVKNPQSFRYNARMNPITSIKKQEFDEIILFLTHLRSDKKRN